MERVRWALSLSREATLDRVGLITTWGGLRREQEVPRGGVGVGRSTGSGVGLWRHEWHRVVVAMISVTVVRSHAEEASLWRVSGWKSSQSCADLK